MLATNPTLSGILTETTIGLPAVAAMLHPSRGGKKVAASTITHWIKRGLLVDGRRVKLEAIKTGVWVTSREAVARFLSATTRGACEEPALVVTPAHRRRQGEAAGRKLEAMGL